MTKREKIRLLKSVWRYLADGAMKAYHSGDETDFDWYCEGQQGFFCALSGTPFRIQSRVKPLRVKEAMGK